MHALCALSAVVENGETLARWLGIPLIQGTAEDRPVPLAVHHELTEDFDEAVAKSLKPCLRGEQALVFCSSRSEAEKTARKLVEVIRSCVTNDMANVAREVLEGDPDAGDLAELLRSGVSYHHAGLPKPTRRAVEAAFRDKRIRIVACTPTLAAGVNLPASVVVVRDIFRSDTVRGTFRRVLNPSGEILNMLGRAARPNQVESGTGVALIERQVEKQTEIKALIAAIRAGRGGTVHSRLPESFEGIMRFVLSVVVEGGDTTREEVAAAYKRTLAYHDDPKPVAFDRPLEEDLMEDVPAYQKVVAARGAICLRSHRLSPAGVDAEIDSSGKRYEVKLAVTGLSCSCPAASKFYRGKICKHQACAIHDLLFGRGIDDEARHRAIFVCGHVFSAVLDPGTLLKEALEVLRAWRLIERIPVGWRATPLGEVASTAGFDLLLVHQATLRVERVSAAAYRDVAHWAIEDYIAEEKDQARWHPAVDQWLDEVDDHKIALPTRYRGDFERRLEDLSRVCLLYEKAAQALGRQELGKAARAAAGALRYGVAPELFPLMALGLPQLGRARSRHLYERGVRRLSELAGADAHSLADPRRVPEALVRGWIARAKEICTAWSTAAVEVAPDAGFDELIARFRIDPIALAPAP